MFLSTMCRLCLFIISGILLFSISSPLYAQQNIGGPYEPDSSTVLLMHFNGDLQNEVDHTAKGESFGRTFFVDLDEAGSKKFGKQLNIENSDTTHIPSRIEIPDTPALDLTGNWTIEMWVLVFKWLYSQEDGLGNRVSLLSKLVDTAKTEQFFANYFVKANDTHRQFETGYYPENEDTSIKTHSTNNSVWVGEWYHITFIRDTSRQMILQMVHQNANDATSLPNRGDSLKLSHYNVYEYNEYKNTVNPRTTEGPLYIGAIPSSLRNKADLNGFIDEVRISNVVRYERTITSMIDKYNPRIPQEITLKPNYPNPFNPTTNIRFSLTHTEKVTLTVYNTIGQKIETLVNRKMNAGFHSITFNAEGLSSGVYIYRLVTGDYKKSEKMLLIK